MSSLKEIRGRINSVSATLKITDVTRMISSAKLRKAQNILSEFLLYKKKISDIFFDYLSLESDNICVPLAEERKFVRNIAIVSFSANTGLCGAFNMNACKKTADIVKSYSTTGNVRLYTIGKKVYDAFAGDKNIKLKGSYHELLESPVYSLITPIADELIDLFLSGEIDEVHVVFNKFKNILTQNITEEILLPLPVQFLSNAETEKVTTLRTDYIIEPDKISLIKTLAPQMFRLSLFEKLLQSVTAEYGARSSAMQAATDNARDLISDLSIEYNKVRQASITGEILDIVGGAEAIKG